MNLGEIDPHQQSIQRLPVSRTYQLSRLTTITMRAPKGGDNHAISRRASGHGKRGSKMKASKQMHGLVSVAWQVRS